MGLPGIQSRATDRSRQLAATALARLPARLSTPLRAIRRRRGLGELAWWCLKTAAAAPGPAWNAGTGCAPGLLWKLAVGAGGGGGGQRDRSGWSGAAEHLTPAHTPAPDAHSFLARTLDLRVSLA